MFTRSGGGEDTIHMLLHSWKGFKMQSCHQASLFKLSAGWSEGLSMRTAAVADLVERISQWRERIKDGCIFGEWSVYLLMCPRWEMDINAAVSRCRSSISQRCELLRTADRFQLFPVWWEDVAVEGAPPG